MNSVMRSIIVLALTLFSTGSLCAQTLFGQDSTRRAITPAVPFLLIAPDARSGAMGDVGAALEPDAVATHWNIGKLAFVDKDYGASLSYTPWLGKIFNDMAIMYLTGYYKIDNEQAVSGSLRYFDLGNISFTNEFADVIGTHNPQEYSVSLGYSRKLSQKLGIGVSAKYIHSNLTGGYGLNGIPSRPGQSVAADIGLYYNSELAVRGQESKLALAAVISNIGNQITYLNDETESFVPTNLRLGTAYTTQLDPYNSLTFAVDLNKLMVPTPYGSLYEFDEDGNILQEPSTIQGIFGSFGDAPDGFSEELKEFTAGVGFEYWYNNIVAGRAGYFFEHADKGGRQFFTLGIGLRYQLFSMDFAYLVPQEQQHPLAETLRFTLAVNFEKSPQQENSVTQ